MDIVDINYMEILQEWETAAHGAKGAVLARRLPLLHMSLATFHRKRRLVGDFPQRKPPAHKGVEQAPERRQWVKAIMQVKHTRHKGAGPLATWNALGLALRQGLVPPEAAELHVGVINRLARTMGLVETPRRGARFEAQSPNELHQVDATGSRHFYPYKSVGGEWILRVRQRQLRNKEKVEGQRVWCWGLVDDHSGFRVQRYCVAPGEAALDGVDFLRWAWMQNPDHAPFEGLPQRLYMDNGVLAKYLPFRAFCEEVGVDLKTHEPYRPQATGKVETGNKDLKKEFEGRFLRDPGWATREISLAELNQELAWFRQETNRTKHRRLPMNKEGAWMRLMVQGGPVRLTPESWERIFTQNIVRTLDDAGCFDLGGAAYQVTGQKVWSCKVRVFQSLTGDALVVEDQRDGQRYAAGPFVPPPAGDYCSAPKMPLEALVEQPLETSTPSWRPETGSKVLHLVRAGEVRESGFEMPEAQDGKPVPLSLEELPAGVEVVAPRPEAPRLFTTPLERYKFLLAKQARGQELTGEEKEFMAWFRAEYREMLALAGQEIDRRVRLAAVE